MTTKTAPTAAETAAKQAAALKRINAILGAKGTHRLAELVR
jgi:hypothetical protein